MSCKLRRTWASQTARARVLCPRFIIFVILQDPVASVSASSFRHHQLKHSPLHHHLRSSAIVCGCIVGSSEGFVLIEVMTIRTWRLPESCISIGGKNALVFSMSVFLYVVGLRVVVMMMRLALGALQIGRNERAARFALYNKLNEIWIWWLIPRKRASEMRHVTKFV